MVSVHTTHIKLEACPIRVTELCNTIKLNSQSKSDRLVHYVDSFLVDIDKS